MYQVKNKKSIFLIASHRCIHALPNILSLIEFANFELEKNVVISCVEALVKYSEPQFSLTQMILQLK